MGLPARARATIAFFTPLGRRRMRSLGFRRSRAPYIALARVLSSPFLLHQLPDFAMTYFSILNNADFVVIF